jgi:hypothetical protein
MGYLLSLQPAESSHVKGWTLPDFHRHCDFDQTLAWFPVTSLSSFTVALSSSDSLLLQIGLIYQFPSTGLARFLFLKTHVIMKEENYILLREMLLFTLPH